MKKHLYTLCFLIIAISGYAQTPNISITTTLSINSQITIGLRGNTASTPIQIDWGNGVKENFTIGNTMEFFGYPVKGSTIKVWGTGITGLSVESKYITALEFVDATLLKSLFCRNNQITTLNLSGCSALEFVECKQNLISSLTLPSTATLTYVDCSDNNLTLSSLPLKPITLTEYIYSPQKEYILQKNIYSINEEIDLSSQLTINGTATTYTWKSASGIVLLNGTDYNVTGGKFTFLKTYNESLYCEMTNTTFPSITFKTVKISIPSTPNVVMTTTNTIGSAFSFSIAALANSTPIQVDWGNGTLVNATIGTSYSTVSGTLAGSTIKIYGNGIKGLDINSKKLTAIDVTKANSLTYLNCDLNQLATLDVSNNTVLKSLHCYSNQLTALDVTKNNALTELYCNSNQLTSLDVTNNTSITTLYCYSNQLTTLDVSKNTALFNLFCYNNKLTSLDLSKNTGLAGLDCFSNQLTALDLSKNIALRTVYCFSNLLTNLDVSNNTAISTLRCNRNKISTLDLSKNIALSDLECDENLLTSLDISKNTALTSVKCSRNKITTLDVSKNTSLVTLDCIFNPITTLDLSANLALKTLYCGYTSITTIDVSKNTALKYFHCDFNLLPSLDVTNNTALTELICHYNKLTTLDVSKNTALTYLGCGYNDLTALDVSANTALTDLICRANQLSTLDVSKNTALKTLECPYNFLKISTLPIKKPTWTSYTYEPQEYLKLPKKQYAVNEPIDLSSEVSADGNNTIFTWKTANGITLAKGVEYTESNGITTFINPQSDFIYCEMTNSVFPGLKIKTELISIPTTDPTITMSTSTTIGSSFSFAVSASNDNNPIKVDWGDGVLTEHVIGYNISTISGTLAGSTLKVYGVGINQLELTSKKITSLDVTKDIALTKLTCQWNQLTTLDLTNNKGLTSFCCSSNQLSALNITNNTALVYLWCDNNLLSTLDVSKNTALTWLYCNNNQLNFGSLPVKKDSWTTYYYKPQATYKFSKTQFSANEVIDLSTQASVNGNSTSFIWKTLGGVTLTKNLDYTEVNGRFTFPNTQSDYIYCQMTNTTFPELTLSTDRISIPSSEPSISITTTLSVGSTFSLSISATANSTPIQVDWGNGTLINSTIETNTSTISGTLTGETIKIYGVGISQIDLTSKSVTALDVSKCTALTFLNCRSNKLKVLDVSKNTALIYLWCSSNFLTSLDVSKNIVLNSLDCGYNQLIFSTLPIKGSGWYTYFYSPQEAYKLSKNSFAINEIIDLSSQLAINGNTTTYVWKTSSGTTLTNNLDYTEDNGKFTFNTIQGNYINCQMTNATFPNLTLSTTYIKVTQFPLSVKEEVLSANIYPNPISNQLWVESDDLVKRVEIYTILGAKVFEQAYTNQSKVNINTTLLPKGMLVVKVYRKNGVVEKIVLKE